METDDLAGGDRKTPSSSTGGRRVLLVLGPSTGGIGVHVASLVRGLSHRGWRVRVLTTPHTSGRFDLGSDVLTPWPDRLSRSPGGVLALRRAAHAAVSGTDVVHAHGHQAGMVALAASMGWPTRRRPIITSWHNATLNGSGRRGLVERWQVRYADLVTGASQDLVDHAAALGARRVLLAPVAAPAAGGWTEGRAVARARLVDQLGLDPALPIVLTVSRIAAQKNLPLLVEASSMLASQTAHSWLIAGEGDLDLTARLRHRIDQTQAPIRLLGHRTDVPMLMAAADVFVLASAWEARALVVQEAMAAGVPVVAPDVGGLHDLLADIGGLVPPGDAARIVTELAGLLMDTGRHAAAADAGRNRYATLPTESAVVDLWNSLYEELIHSGRLL